MKSLTFIKSVLFRLKHMKWRDFIIGLLILLAAMEILRAAAKYLLLLLLLFAAFKVVMAIVHRVLQQFRNDKTRPTP
jgi:uncharacterized membrane protein HdeD (DUF308 family)